MGFGNTNTHNVYYTTWFGHTRMQQTRTHTIGSLLTNRTINTVDCIRTFKKKVISSSFLHTYYVYCMVLATHTYTQCILYCSVLVTFRCSHGVYAMCLMTLLMCAVGVWHVTDGGSWENRTGRACFMQDGSHLRSVYSNIPTNMNPSICDVVEVYSFWYEFYEISSPVLSAGFCVIWSPGFLVEMRIPLVVTFNAGFLLFKNNRTRVFVSGKAGIMTWK